MSNAEVEHVDDDDDIRALHLVPDLEGVRDVATRNTDFGEEETMEILELIVRGYGEYEAGLSLAWTPAKIRRFTSDPHIREIIWAIHEAENEGVERSIRRTANLGNPAAQRLWAFNKMAHRGWSDKRSVRLEGEVDHAIVVSVKQALEETTREQIRMEGPEGVAALQASIGLGDDPEGDVIDAELVE